MHKHFCAASSGACPHRPPPADTPRSRLLPRAPGRPAAPLARPSARRRAAQHGPPGAGLAPQDGGGEETARGKWYGTGSRAANENLGSP